MSILKRSEATLILGSAIISMFALAGTAFAATGSSETSAHANFAHPAVIGTVSAVNGDILTVAEATRTKGGTASSDSAVMPTTAYTVDATNATVTKNNAASTVGAIAVGDTVMVQGTVSGTNVTAKTIRDGVMSRGQMSGQKPKTGTTPNVPAITGNGEPVVGGSVTAISGNSITITNKSNVTYTIDATNATVSKTSVTGATISNIAVGDSVVVQGTVNGTSVVASSVIDQGAPASADSTGSPQATPTHQGNGFFGAIGSFFTRIFGFF